MAVAAGKLRNVLTPGDVCNQCFESSCLKTACLWARAVDKRH